MNRFPFPRLVDPYTIQDMVRRFLARWLALLVLLFAFLIPAAARAGSLSAEEQEILGQGGVVKRTFDVDLPQGEYIGGLAYVIIPAPPAKVMALLLEPQSYYHIFPRTQEARLVAREGEDWLLTLRQGNKRVTGQYTVRARRETPSLVRFWMEPAFPHDIGDLWGYFRVDPTKDGSTLLTYGALLHLEFGVIKLLFQEAIREVALETPELVRDYVGERRSALAER